MLQACGWDLVQIKRIRNPNKGSFGAYNQDNYSKLRAWLLPFRRVIFLDADMIVARSLDHLFEEDVSAAAASAPTELTAANDCLYSSTYPDIEFFNSGMMLLTPSAREFANMTRLMHVLPSYTGGDQGFLNSYFRGRRVRRLPIAYNFMRMHEGDKTAFERYAAANANVIKVYHFTGTKPWECGPREECCLNRSPEECADSRFESPTFHSLWWKTYAQMAQDDESGGAVAARRLVVRRWQQVDL